jgi:hypothetical protein
VVSFVSRINRRRNKGPMDWRAEHTPYISLWNARELHNGGTDSKIINDKFNIFENTLST